MIEFHRWTVYRHEDGKVGFTHLVVAGGLVMSCCGVWHHDGEEKCERADNWTLVRSVVAS